MYQAIVGVLRGAAETKASLMLSIILNVAYFVWNGFVRAPAGHGSYRAGDLPSAVQNDGNGDRFRLSSQIQSVFAVQNQGFVETEFLDRQENFIVGIPFASEQLFFNGGKLLIQTFIVQFGTMALTANAIGSSLAMLFQTGSNALSIAIVTVVGQCIGRNDIQEGRKVVSQAGVILNFWLCPPAGYSAGGSNQFPFSANVPHSLCLPVYHKHGMLKMKKGAVGQHDSPRTTAASRAVGLYGLTTK